METWFPYCHHVLPCGPASATFWMAVFWPFVLYFYFFPLLNCVLFPKLIFFLGGGRFWLLLLGDMLTLNLYIWKTKLFITFIFKRPLSQLKNVIIFVSPATAVGETKQSLFRLSVCPSVNQKLRHLFISHEPVMQMLSNLKHSFTGWISRTCLKIGGLNSFFHIKFRIFVFLYLENFW